MKNEKIPMKDSTRYVLWAALLMLLLSCYAIANIMIGLKPLSVGMVITTCATSIATVILFVIFYRRRKRGL